jgi:hypothetical protein
VTRSCLSKPRHSRGARYQKAEEEALYARKVQSAKGSVEFRRRRLWRVLGGGSLHRASACLRAGFEPATHGLGRRASHSSMSAQGSRKDPLIREDVLTEVLVIHRRLRPVLGLHTAWTRPHSNGRAPAFQAGDGVRFPSPALLFSVYWTRSDWLLVSHMSVLVCRRLVVLFNLPRPNRCPDVLWTRHASRSLLRSTMSSAGANRRSVGLATALRPRSAGRSNGQESGKERTSRPPVASYP